MCIGLPAATRLRVVERLMHISEILKQGSPTLSFEFFPPKSDRAAETLFQTIRELESCKPSFVSVTYGAGGSTRDLTHQLVLRILTETTVPPVPHFTCVSHSEEEIEEILRKYAAAGVKAILALRGDLPQDRGDYDRSNDAFQYAGELVRFIRRFNEAGHHPGGGFGIGDVAITCFGRSLGKHQGVDVPQFQFGGESFAVAG